jgi:hypothetical protein
VKAILSWNALLTEPAPENHLVQLYVEDGVLLRALRAYIGAGLAAGDAVIVISTDFHWMAVARRLTADGFDVSALQRRTQLTVLDARQCLARFIVNGMPDRAAFLALVTPVVQAARAAGYAKVRAFGEMVDLLNRDGSLASAMRLEELWNEFLRAEELSLLCAYALDTFDRDAHRGALPQIGDVHSHLMPVEDVGRLDRAVGQAFADVYGADCDATLLQMMLASRFPTDTAMPAAHAAILALRDLDPRGADFVLERARRYYRTA